MYFVFLYASMSWLEYDMVVRGPLTGVGLSFHHVGPGDRTAVITLDRLHIYLLRQLSGPGYSSLPRPPRISAFDQRVGKLLADLFLIVLCLSTNVSVPSFSQVASAKSISFLVSDTSFALFDSPLPLLRFRNSLGSKWGLALFVSSEQESLFYPPCCPVSKNNFLTGFVLFPR